MEKSESSRIKSGLKYAAIFSLSLAAAFLGVAATVTTNHHIVSWLLSGMSLGLAFIYGRRAIISLFISSLVANFAAYADFSNITPAAVITPFLIAMLDTAQVYAVCKISNKIVSRSKNTLKVTNFYVLIAAGVASSIIYSLILPTILFSFQNDITMYKSVFFNFITNASSIIIFAPSVISLLLTHHDRSIAEKKSEIVAAAATLFFSTQIIFLSYHIAPMTTDVHLHYIILPILLWFIFRFTTKEMVIAFMFVVAVATGANLHGHGPFAYQGLDDSLESLFMYLAVISIALYTIAANITKRKTAESELRLLNRYLDNKLNEKRKDFAYEEQVSNEVYIHSPLAICLFDQKGKIKNYNNRALEITGYTPEEAESFNLFRTDRIKIGNLDALRNGEYIETESWYRFTESGKSKFLKTRVSPISSIKGEITDYLLMIEDLTELKQTYEELVKSDARFKQMADIIPAQIYIKKDGRFLFVNKQTADFYGTTEDSLTGKLQSQFHINADEMQKIAEAEESINTGKRQTLIATHISTSSDGRKHTLTTQMLPYFFKNTDDPAILTISQDISDQKTAEENLKKNEQKFKALYAHSPIGIALFNDDGYILDVNPVILGMFGVYEVDTLNDFNLFDLEVIPDEEKTKIRNKLPVKFRTCVNFDTSLAIQKYDSPKKGISYIELAVNYIPTTGYIVIVQDITEEHKAHNALMHSSQRLKTIFNNAGIGIALLDKNGTYQMINTNFCEIIQIQESEITGKAFNKSENFESHDLLSEKMRNLLSGTINSFTIEDELTTVTGQAWVNISATPLKDENGFLENIIIVLLDVTALKAAQKELIELATHDPLTKLPNRRHFNKRLEEAISRSKRNGKFLTLLFLDLDGFKEVNDTLGHSAGDELLLTISSRILNNVREIDMVSRLGGDEFTVILESMQSYQDIDLVASRILKSISEPAELKGKIVKVSASVGISIFPDNTTDKEELIKLADNAMYASKKSGKNRYTFHNNLHKTEK